MRNVWFTPFNNPAALKNRKKIFSHVYSCLCKILAYIFLTFNKKISAQTISTDARKSDSKNRELFFFFNTYPANIRFHMENDKSEN